MELAPIVNQYYDSFIKKYGSTLLPAHVKALKSIQKCRTSDSGEVYIRCSRCKKAEWRALSCGHRSCPKCQNHEASLWIERQQIKLLPVHYFMVTFTLPYELRSLTSKNPRSVYSIFFDTVSRTLKEFGLNKKHLGAEIGMTMVLHTHNRKKDFHPHIYVVVPGGGVDKKRRQWKKKKGNYLFKQENLATVFRAKFLNGLNQEKITVPQEIPQRWVVDCTSVGKGITAVKYLSRYLYRGVISENNIVSNEKGLVTFKYVESQTGHIRYRTLEGSDFLQLITQHVLPKGFRRVRDYGFLHSNARKLLLLVQLVLRVDIKEIKQRLRPVFKCPGCKMPMEIVGFQLFAWASG